MIFKHKTFQQFFVFCLVGGVSTIVNFGVFAALLHGAQVNYLISSAAGFLGGVAVGFELNRRITFAQGATSAQQKAKYGMVYLFSLACSLIFLKIVVDGLGVDATIANILSIGMTTCINFIGVKWIVFRK